MTSAHHPDVEHRLAVVARSLFEPGSVAAILQRIVDHAVAQVEACDGAGIVLLDNGLLRCTAYSSPSALELCDLHVSTGEGPCLEAATAGSCHVPVLDDDVRWPAFGPAAAAAGVRSLFAVEVSSEKSSAMCLHSRLPSAFGVVDRAKVVLLATLAGVALKSAEEREADAQHAENLRAALATREIIGQAQGILMERERITANDAFHVLRRASQHLNMKLRDVAQDLIDTGETGDPTPDSP